MNQKTRFGPAALLLVGVSAGLHGQQVYRCKLADGSTTFSDLPCKSDVGRQDTVDATPHQGHRASPHPGAPAYTMPDDKPDAGAQQGREDAAPTRQAGDRHGASLSRRERMSLERERKSLLSELKRRHISAKERRAMISDLRKLDRKLGFGPEDVPDMPAHDRDVYDEHSVYPGEFEVIGNDYGVH